LAYYTRGGSTSVNKLGSTSVTNYILAAEGIVTLRVRSKY